VHIKYWEIIAGNLSKAGWSWGCSSQIDSTGRVLFTADAYSRDGRRFIVLSDDKLSAFLELESQLSEDAPVHCAFTTPGFNIGTGGNNIDIANDGNVGDQGTIRIGDELQTRTFIAGISGAGVATAPRAITPLICGEKPDSNPTSQ
jgi:hypothetical protein